MDGQADGWLREHPKVEVTLPGRPEGDWRDEEGYGWIAKIWFHTWGDAQKAKAAISSEGWTPGSLGGKSASASVTDATGRGSRSSCLNGGRTSGASSFVATDARLGQCSGMTPDEAAYGQPLCLTNGALEVNRRAFIAAGLRRSK